MAKKTTIAINGFGRIGRKILRLSLDQTDLEVTHINDPGSLETLAHLLEFDSVHGRLKADIRVEGSALWVNGRKILVSTEKDVSKLHWTGVDVVHECTGLFTEREKALAHIQQGAKRVIISAPSKDADATFCMGVNESTFDPQKHFVVSNASCTTNCLAPVAKVLHDSFGIVRGTMLTVHAYTNDQRILDLPHKDLRRARAAALSMIPTSTGAAKAVGIVLPELKGKLDGHSIRVPTPNVSMVDFTAELSKSTSKEAVNAALEAAAKEGLRGILAVEPRPLVSTDFNGSVHSSTVDTALTMVMGGTLVKVIAWYDNESGFSARMLDLTRFLFART